MTEILNVVWFQVAWPVVDTCYCRCTYVVAVSPCKLL